MYCKIRCTSTVTVLDYRNLRAAWDAYGHTGLVAEFRCETPLTPSPPHSFGGCPPNCESWCANEQTTHR